MSIFRVGLDRSRSEPAGFHLATPGGAAALMSRSQTNLVDRFPGVQPGGAFRMPDIRALLDNLGPLGRLPPIPVLFARYDIFKLVNK